MIWPTAEFLRVRTGETNIIGERRVKLKKKKRPKKKLEGTYVTGAARPGWGGDRMMMMMMMMASR